MAGYFITVKKASDTGKPELRIVEAGKYTSETHGGIYAGVKDIGPLICEPEKAHVRLLRDGNMHVCPVRNIPVTVTAQVVLHSGELPESFAGRTERDFLEVLEVIR